jgi:hypothetical protein
VPGGSRDGWFDLGDLAAGHYLLRPFTRSDAWLGHTGTRGSDIGTPTTIEVHADGRLTPEVVWPDGVK